jgi:hypothetical protein
MKFIGLNLVLFCISAGIMLPVFIPYAIGVMSIISQDFAAFWALFVVAGLLAIPCWCVAIWINTRLLMAGYILADCDTGIADSIIWSWRISSGNFWMLLIAVIVLSVLSTLGVIICCVGIFTTIAFYWFGCALVYLQLTGQPNSLGYRAR